MPAAQIYKIEIDASNPVATYLGFNGGIALPMKKGESFKPFRVESESKLVDRGGIPDPTFSLSTYSALSYLTLSDKLWAVRVHDGTALISGISVYADSVSAAGMRNISWSQGILKENIDGYLFSNDEIMLILGANEGDWNHNICPEFTNFDYDEGTFDIQVWEINSTGRRLLETWPVSRQRIKDGFGHNLYIEDVINGKSQYIQILDNPLISNDVFPKANPSQGPLEQTTTRNILVCSDVTGGDNGSLNNNYFLFDYAGSGFYVWFNLDGTGVDPLVSSRVAIPVAVTTGMDAEAVAIATRTALVTTLGLDATVIGSEVIILGTLAVFQDGNIGSQTYFDFSTYTFTGINMGQDAIAAEYSIDCIPFSSLNPSSDYFTLFTQNGAKKYDFYFKSLVSTVPAMSGGVPIEINASALITAADVALAIRNTINQKLPNELSAEINGTTVLIRQLFPGLCPAPSSNVGNAGFILWWDATTGRSVLGQAAVNAYGLITIPIQTGLENSQWIFDIAGQSTGVIPFSYSAVASNEQNIQTTCQDIINAINVSPGINGYTAQLLDPTNIPNVIKVSSTTSGTSGNAKIVSRVDYLRLNGGYNGGAVSLADLIKGYEMFRNREEISVNILMDGGVAVPQLQQKLIEIAESRMDCVSILSTPLNYELSTDYLNLLAQYRRSELAANSSYAGLYSPHVKVYDKYSDKTLDIGVDGFVAGKFSYTATAFEPWFAVAGWNRGILNILGLSRVFSKDDRDFLQDNQINPIRFRPGYGYAIWGHRTLLSKKSALDRFNVRMLLITTETAIEEFLEFQEFEINDEYTRNTITRAVETALTSIQSRRGLYGFDVVCNTDNNTPAVIDQNYLYLDVYVKPTKTAEFIKYRTIVTDTGVSFDNVRIGV